MVFLIKLTKLSKLSTFNKCFLGFNNYLKSIVLLIEGRFQSLLYYDKLWVHMAISYKMRQLIDEMAQEVIKIYDILIPVNNIDRVVEKIGGRVIENPELDFFSDGKIRKDGDSSFIIEISPGQSMERRNFTIAHELGHLFLHMGFDTDEDRWNSQQSIVYYRTGCTDLEYQSNEFAAALLMPKKQFIDVLYANSEENIVNIGAVASYFNVSVDAASNRGKWLGYLQW